jgi:hypothetical protein
MGRNLLSIRRKSLHYLIQKLSANKAEPNSKLISLTWIECPSAARNLKFWIRSGGAELQTHANSRSSCRSHARCRLRRPSSSDTGGEKVRWKKRWWRCILPGERGGSERSRTKATAKTFGSPSAEPSTTTGSILQKGCEKLWTLGGLRRCKPFLRNELSYLF